MDGPLGLLEVAPAAIAAVMVIRHLRAERRVAAAAAAAEDEARAPHA